MRHCYYPALPGGQLLDDPCGGRVIAGLRNVRHRGRRGGSAPLAALVRARGDLQLAEDAALRVWSATAERLVDGHEESDRHQDNAGQVLDAELDRRAEAPSDFQSQQAQAHADHGEDDNRVDQ